MKNMIKLNLGCGPTGINGWLNYDWGLLPLVNKMPGLIKLLVILGFLKQDYVQKWPKFGLVDIRKKLPLKNKSVDYIYCSHVLEHFEKQEALSILGECKRILKAKGYLRIVLPDLSKMINNYEGAEKFNREYYGFDKDLYIGIVNKIKQYFIRGHQWMYDVATTKELLKEVGFKEISVCVFRKGKVPDLKFLDIEQHRDLSLYLEAGGKN